MCAFDGGHIHHLAVHAQQEGDHVTGGELALAGALVDGGGGAQLILRAGHSDGGGGGGAGGQGGEGAADLVAVHPDGAQVFIVVVHVVLLDRRQAGKRAVAVDGGPGGGEGQGQALVGAGHVGALGVGGHQSGVVHLAVGDSIAQGGAVYRAAAVVADQQVIEEHDAVLAGEGLPLNRVHIVPQPHGGGLGQLGGGIGARQGGGVIAQHLQQGGAGLLQGDLVVRPEGAVYIAAHPALLHRQLDVLAGPVVALDVLKQGDTAALPDAVLIAGGRRHHGDKLRPGRGGGEVQVSGAVSGDDPQGLNGLHCRGGTHRPRRDHQGQRQSRRQQGGGDRSFHIQHSLFVVMSGPGAAGPRWINRSAARRWG